MSEKWTGQTGGTHWMQRALVGIIRHVDIRIIYGLMHLWLVWYVIVRPIPRKGIYRFHRHRGRNRFQSAIDVYRSFYEFGKVILDRFAVYAGCEYAVEVENSELYYGRVKSEEGFIMLFSHLGNTEMAGYFLSTPEKKMHILAYGGESPVVTENRAKVLARNNIEMILVQNDDISHVYRINEVLQQGDVLAMGADRRMEDSCIACPFMGADALFPKGAFQISVSMGKPVLLFFVIKEDARKYKVYCRQLEVEHHLSKKDQVQALANEYAKQLEEMTIRYPYQWFNMYDFWSKEK